MKVKVKQDDFEITFVHKGEVITEAHIVPGVKDIRSNALREFYTLTVIKMPPSVQSIGDYAFHYCTSLETITIPSSVTNIQRGVFNSCISLTSIIIPNGVKQIGTFAFYGCKSLRAIVIPPSVKIIHRFAFDNCTSLERVYLPTNTKIEWETFPAPTKIIRGDGWYKIGPCIMMRYLNENGRAIPKNINKLDKDLQILQYLVEKENDDIFRTVMEFVSSF